MALGSGEGNAVNIVIKWALDIPRPGAFTDADARGAMKILLKGAWRALMAGLKPDDVDEAFDAFLAAREPDTLDAAMYLLARADTWSNVTVALPMAQREAMADAALRYEAQAIDDGEDRLDPRNVRWWR